MIAPEQTTMAASAAYCGSATCLALSFLGENAAGIGVLIAIITYATNLYFQIKRNKK